MLPNVTPPVVEDSCLSPMMDRAIVRGFGYGESNISPRARCTTRMAVVLCGLVLATDQIPPTKSYGTHGVLRQVIAQLQFGIFQESRSGRKAGSP